MNWNDATQNDVECNRVWRIEMKYGDIVGYEIDTLESCDAVLKLEIEEMLSILLPHYSIHIIMN